VGAHYDHLGLGGAGSLAPWTKEIHNGADDNASGTAALLEIARQLATGPKPKHRIVFMAFTGEERGLLGSAKYVRNPRFALENTIAMFNLDMVGRLTDDKLVVYGTGTAEEFDPLVTRLCAEHQFKLTKQPGGFGPSDHSSFYAKKIPVLHFFTGNHADYHRPSDDPDKLNIAGMRRVADLVVATVRATDAAQTRPKYLEVKRMESIAIGPERKLPWFGSIPDYAAEVEGLAISGVQPESPAAKAGLKGGDVVVKLGESKIGNIEDFMSALMKHKPGDTLKVVVLRGKEQVESEITLSSRPKGP
jgi:Zn-dependent M28 family amino/carboxypeptidase